MIHYPRCDSECVVYACDDDSFFFFSFLLCDDDLV